MGKERRTTYNFHIKKLLIKESKDDKIDDASTKYKLCIIMDSVMLQDFKNFMPRFMVKDG